MIKNDEKVKEIFKQTIYIYSTVPFLKKETISLVNTYYSLSGRGSKYFYLNDLKGKFNQTSTGKENDLIIDSLAMNMAARITRRGRGFGRSVYIKLVSNSQIYKMIGRQYPVELSGISVFDFMNEITKRWLEFQRYCKASGKSASDISVATFKEFIISLKKKYKYYPFTDNKTFKGFNGDELKEFEKLEDYLVQVRGIIETIYYSSNYCDCLDFNEFYLEYFEENLKENQKEWSKRKSDFESDLKGKCDKLSINNAQFTTKKQELIY